MPPESAANGSSHPWYLHPFVIANLQSQVVQLTAGFTSSHSIWRPIVLVGLLISSAYSIYRFPAYITINVWPARVLGSVSLGLPLHFFDRLILRRWAFGDGQPSPSAAVKQKLEGKRKKLDGSDGKQGEESTFTARRKFGQEVARSSRDAGKPWEVKNVPHFSTRDPNWVPSRPEFIARRLFLLLFCYYAQLFTIDAIAQYSDSVLLSDSHVPLLSRLGNVSVQEVYFRVVIIFVHWLWQYCYLQGFHALFSVIDIAFNPSNIPLWRPFFGDFVHSYTLRNFWG